MPSANQVRSEARDFYEVLGAKPSASAAELRAAFREAVLRHHPDRATSSDVATRRTSMLNRAWTALRDPVRRLHYDHDLEMGREEMLEWPIEAGEPAGPARRRARRGAPPLTVSRWHQPQWRSVAGFRVPAEVFMAGPAAQERWIVEHHIAGEDWHDHTERYWLRFAARHYAEHGRTEDRLGALEKAVRTDPPLNEIIAMDLRDAYLATGEELRGAMVVAEIAGRRPAGSPLRRWANNELRVLLGEYRDQHVKRGPPAQRAENAELLLNFLESLELEPSFTDYRAAIVAHRRVGHAGRAARARRAGGGAARHRRRALVQPRAAPDRGRTARSRVGDAGRDRARRPSRGSRPAARPGPAASHRDGARAPGARPTEGRFVIQLASLRALISGAFIGAAAVVFATWISAADGRVFPYTLFIVLFVALTGLALGSLAATAAFITGSLGLVVHALLDPHGTELASSDVIRLVAFAVGSPAVIFLVRRSETSRDEAARVLAASREATSMASARGTALEQARQELDDALAQAERERARLEEVAEAIPEPLVVYDGALRGTYGNRAALRVFGRSFVERPLDEWGRLDRAT